ncbi:hypothetical protein LFT45_11770 [Arthrobacter sp. FW305-BF8]|uniref:hypothetical protein n=1 Tax=Arthrobacter sp. FW305-BF8 TaxID=2879617 RepID=UPI001F228C3D|nr:hypothetical protein [Arthrobacter sp. FW305-BF8]UKA52447.1 hypothetical protein LFT45_11770 [Arthrobacter sp. FW305-BF8]
MATAGLGAVALLAAAGASPANAASTEGRQTFTYDVCLTDEEVGLVSCLEGSERRIEVRTASGVVIMQGQSEFSTCVFETDFLSAIEKVRYDHGTLTCTAP